MNQGLSLSPFFKPRLLIFTLCSLLVTLSFGKTDLVHQNDPIQLLTYEVRLASDVAVIIEWTTKAEYQNDYFLIERSTDSVYWDVLGEVGGSGNSNIPVQYTFLDQEPVSGISIYRLKQISTTGDYTYPAIKQIAINPEDPGLQILSATPNPFVDHFTITFQNRSASEVNLTIFNQEGEALLREKINAKTGRNEFSLNAPTPLPDGLYVLSMLGQEQQLRTYLMIKGQQYISQEESQIEPNEKADAKE